MSEAGETEPKKQKMTPTSKIPEAEDKDWPEAWYMEETDECKDQKAENRQTPNKPATVEDLRKLGIQYWKMDADAYEYPVKAVPWDPQDAPDPKLAALRDDRKYLFFWSFYFVWGFIVFGLFSFLCAAGFLFTTRQKPFFCVCVRIVRHQQFFP